MSALITPPTDPNQLRADHDDFASAIDSLRAAGTLDTCTQANLIRAMVAASTEHRKLTGKSLPLTEKELAGQFGQMSDFEVWMELDITKHGKGDQIHVQFADPEHPGETAYGTFADSAEAQDFMVHTARQQGVTSFDTGDVDFARAQRQKRIAEMRERAENERAEAARIANTPVIGNGATLHYPEDKHGYVVMAVSANGSKVTLAHLREPNLTTGHKPAGDCNGFPVWDHTYTPEEIAEGSPMRYDAAYVSHAYLRKNGGYYLDGIRVTFDGARYYRNYAD